MLNKILLTMALVVGLVIPSAVMAQSPTYSWPSCFMTLDYATGNNGPTPKAWFVDKEHQNIGRNYIENDGSLWRTGSTSETIPVRTAGTFPASWLCPEPEAPMVLAVETPAPPPKMAEPETFVVHFDFDKSNIRPDQEKVLQDAISFAQENGYASILLESYCDFRGTVPYNDALGERRAKAVRIWLENNGIEATAFQTVDNGKRRSLVRKLVGKFCKKCWKDRRVEITIAPSK
jgi:outer membrane protein OmpA-like peptidoglycan-associated protein